jgi:hypothetical protein
MTVVKFETETVPLITVVPAPAVIEPVMKIGLADVFEIPTAPDIATVPDTTVVKFETETVPLTTVLKLLTAIVPDTAVV